MFNNHSIWQIQTLRLPDHFTELRALELIRRDDGHGYDWEPRGSIWYDGQNLDEIRSWSREQDARGHDVFIGPNPRFHNQGKKKEDVNTVVACFADLDLDGERIEEAYQHLTGLARPPSFCVHSGRGIHAYWLIEPSEDKGLWKRVNTGIWEDLKGDWKADSAVKTDEARVLRLVPYPNRKTGAGPVSVFPTADPIPRYTLADLAEVFPLRQASVDSTSQKTQPVGRKPNWADPSARFPDGTRTEAMMGLAGTLRGRGLDEHLIRYALEGFNEKQCDPPCSDAKVEGIARSASRYAPDDGGAESPREQLVQDFDEYIRLDPPKYHEGTPLPSGEISVLYGFTGTYKSFVAIHWAFQVARYGPIVYVCGEDHAGVAVRVEGYARACGLGGAWKNFKLVKRGLAMLDPQRKELEQLVEELEARNRLPALIVFDTMSANFFGRSGATTSADENVRGFLTNCRWLSHRCGGASTLVVAHTTKDGSTFAGSQVLMNDAACFMKAKKTERRDLHATVTVEKQKNSPPRAPLHYELELVPFCPPALTYLSGRSSDSRDESAVPPPDRSAVTCVVRDDPWFSRSSDRDRSRGTTDGETPNPPDGEKGTDAATRDSTVPQGLTAESADFLRGVYAAGRRTAGVADGAEWLAARDQATPRSKMTTARNRFRKLLEVGYVENVAEGQKHEYRPTSKGEAYLNGHKESSPQPTPACGAFGPL